MYLVNSY